MEVRKKEKWIISNTWYLILLSSWFFAKIESSSVDIYHNKIWWQNLKQRKNLNLTQYRNLFIEIKSKKTILFKSFILFFIKKYIL